MPETTGTSAAQVRKGRLTAVDAARIFKTKYHKTANTSKLLAQRHGVTAKAIRDVWSLKTWVLITMPHWTEEDRRRFSKMPLVTSRHGDAEVSCVLGVHVCIHVVEQARAAAGARRWRADHSVRHPCKSLMGLSQKEVSQTL